MSFHDPYFKLRPPALTPLEELCHCERQPPLKLMCALTYNPVHCIDCNLEVLPETLELPFHLVEPIAHWRSLHDAVYRLWLDSGAYEPWAQEELTTITSAVNHEGLRVRAELEAVRRCYFWYFQDQAADDFTPITICPSCSQPFSMYMEGLFPQYVCDTCSIITVGAE